MTRDFDAPYRVGKKDYRIFWPLLLPAMLENVINTLFGIADSAMLKSTGHANRAIAAVGVTGSLNNWVCCITVAFLIGLTVSIAQAYGRGDKDACRRLTQRFLPISVVVGLVLSLIFSLGAPLFVTLIGANDEIKEEAILYFRIVAVGYFAHVVVSMITAALRGIGITRLPMFYSVGSGALNVLLNWCLIGGHLGMPALGVAGAAIATTVSRLVSLAAAVLVLFFAKNDVSLRGIRLFSKAARADARQVSLKNTFITGSTSAGEQFLLQTGAVVTTMILTVLSTADFAAYQVTAGVENISWAIGGAFCTVSTTMAGHAKGRGDLSCARAQIKLTWLISLLFGIALTAFYFLCGTAMASLYTDDAAVAAQAARMMYISAFTLFGIFTHSTFAGGMRGLGYPTRPLIASLISLWVCRVVGTYLTVRVLHLDVFFFYLCILADQWVRGTVNLILYRCLIRKSRKKSPLSA